MAVHLFAQEQGYDEVLAGDATDSVDLSDTLLFTHDLGVDGLLVDSASERILVIQCAHRRNVDDVLEKLKAFSGIVDHLRDADYIEKHGSPAAQLLLGDIPDRIEDGWSIDLRFVTQLALGDKEKFWDSVDAINNGFGDNSDIPISLELYGRAELLQKAEDIRLAVRDAPVAEITLHFQKDKCIYWDEEHDAPRKTFVSLLKGNELVNIYNQHGKELFAANIRLPLIRTQKVNPEIKRTARDRSADFFYFNNGVSAVCKEFEIIDDHVVRAKNFQVINGAQTVHCISQAIGKKPNDELYVLFRLTETDESYGGPFTENVIRFNNTQTPVKASDFFANDAIQLWLRDNLDKRSGKTPIPAFQYIHKAGYKADKDVGRKQLKIDAFAGIRHAFIYGPTVSYREPATFFDRNEKYAEAFGVDGKIEASWDDETLNQALCAYAVYEEVYAFGNALKKNPDTKDLPEARYLRRLARYVAALIGEGLRVLMPKEIPDHSVLMASPVMFHRYVDPLMKEARRLVRYQMEQLQDKYVQPEYKFGRDEDAWLILKKRMRDSVLTGDVEFKS